MLGSLFVTAGLSLSGAPLALPQSLRLGWLTVIGTALGSTFTVSLLQRASSLSLSISCLLALSVISTLASATLFSKVGKFDNATSFFAAVPGGLSDMTQIGADAGGSERTIALCHTIRLVTTVVLFPLLIKGSAAGLSLPPPPLAIAALPLTALDAGLLASCALLGPQLGRLLRLPARFLVGPMLMSAVLHLAGLTDARPPPQLLQAAQVVVGAAVGTRFVGVRLEQLRGPAALALCATALQLLLATGAALLLRSATGAPLALLLLSLSPGGITEMTLTALACGLDSAFVATHHTIRIVAITSLTPLLFALGKEAQRRRGLKSA